MSKVARPIRRNISLVWMLPVFSIPWNYGLIIRYHSFGIRMESYLWILIEWGMRLGPSSVHYVLALSLMLPNSWRGTLPSFSHLPSHEQPQINAH